MGKEQELLTDEERGKVYIPCELRCGQTMPDMESEICLDCIAIEHEKAQIAKLKSLGYEQVWEKCPVCVGRGEYLIEGEGTNTDILQVCSNCKGTGKVRIQFKLPEGIEEKIARIVRDTRRQPIISEQDETLEITKQILSLIRQDNGGEKQ